MISLQVVAGPFLQLLQFVSPEREARPERPRSFSRPEAGRRDSLDKREERECSVLACYQMSCLAQQLSIGGFDLAAGSRCSCEHSGGHCRERMR